MKILVVSDSHSTLRFMRSAIELTKPDTVIHLGDYYEDGCSVRQEYPALSFIQVPGNCDFYRIGNDQPEILVRTLDGVKIYITHGHRHNVKLFTACLLQDARAVHSDIVLYGHTHEPNCYQESDGLWVLNPGSCGFSGGSIGLIDIQNRAIVSCDVICAKDLEEEK